MVPLPARSGPLEVTRPGLGPPLSLEKTMSVLLRKPFSSKRGDDLADGFVHRREHAGIGAAHAGEVGRKARDSCRAPGAARGRH